MRLKTGAEPREPWPPRDRWISLDKDTPGSSGWDWTNNKRTTHQEKWDNGVLTLENRAISFNSIQAQDISFRAKVKFIEGNNCALTIRSKQGGAADLYALFSKKPGNKLYVAFLNTNASATVNVPNDFVLFEVTAIGDQATIQVNGVTAVRYRVKSLQSGPISITAYDARGLFKDLEVKILDK
jgi:hypothetical protein